MKCLCGQSKEYDDCCGAIIENKRVPMSPEELMRSRYSAYVKGNEKYLVLSAIQENQYNDDIKLIEEFTNSVQWLKLDVLCVKDNTVEFKAYYREKDGIKVLHEKSNFIQENGMWKYADGELYN